MPDIQVAGLCDQREPDINGDWACTEPLGHDDQGWHWDPVFSAWWKRREGGGVEAVPDPEFRASVRAARELYREHHGGSHD